MRTQHSTAGKPQTLPGCLRSHEQGIPKGFCFKFHRGVQCVPGCAFKHLCYKFEGPQKAVNVIFIPKAKTLGNNPSCQVPTLKALTCQHP